MNQLRKLFNRTYLNTNLISLTKRSSSTTDNLAPKQYPAPEDEARKEVESALEIEASLFENSSNTRQHLSKSRQLKKYIESDSRNEPLQKLQDQKKSLPKLQKFSPKSYEPVVIKDKTLGLSFTKLKLNDPIFNNLLTSVRSSKRRAKKRQIILEGRRLILEALASGLKLKTIVFSQKDQLELINEEITPHRKSIEIYKVPHHDLKTWSTLTTPPGLLAIFDRPSDENLQLPVEDQTFPITVICDNIREPNNLGSIIRTCAAIPCHQVIVLKGCCDPWETKALRGGCGAQFRIQIKDDIEWNNVLEHLPEEFKTFAAENNIEKVKNYNFSNTKQKLIKPYLEIGNVSPHYVIIIGGETHGVSEIAYDFVDCAGDNGAFLHIPLAAGVESLNTSCALSLILFEIRRQTSLHHELVQ